MASLGNVLRSKELWVSVVAAAVALGARVFSRVRVEEGKLIKNPSLSEKEQLEADRFWREDSAGPPFVLEGDPPDCIATLAAVSAGLWHTAGDVVPMERCNQLGGRSAIVTGQGVQFAKGNPTGQA